MPSNPFLSLVFFPPLTSHTRFCRVVFGLALDCISLLLCWLRCQIRSMGFFLDASERERIDWCFICPSGRRQRPPPPFFFITINHRQAIPSVWTVRVCGCTTNYMTCDSNRQKKKKNRNKNKEKGWTVFSDLPPEIFVLDMRISSFLIKKIKHA